MIRGLFLAQLKLEIQLGQNFGNKKIGRVNPGQEDTPLPPQENSRVKILFGCY